MSKLSAFHIINALYTRSVKTVSLEKEMTDFSLFNIRARPWSSDTTFVRCLVFVFVWSQSILYDGKTVSDEPIRLKPLIWNELSVH